MANPTPKTAKVIMTPKGPMKVPKGAKVVMTPTGPKAVPAKAKAPVKVVKAPKAPKIPKVKVAKGAVIDPVDKTELVKRGIVKFNDMTEVDVDCGMF